MLELRDSVSKMYDHLYESHRTFQYKKLLAETGIARKLKGIVLKDAVVKVEKRKTLQSEKPLLEFKEASAEVKEPNNLPETKT